MKDDPAISNFHFLDKQFPVLSKIGGLAEKYCYSDSNSCLIKLGMLGETIVNLMYAYDKVPDPEDDSAANRIKHLQSLGLLSKDLVSILHILRKARNKALHDNYESREVGSALLEMAFGLCKWFAQTYGGMSYSHTEYNPPKAPAARTPSTAGTDWAQLSGGSFSVYTSETMGSFSVVRQPMPPVTRQRLSLPPMPPSSLSKEETARQREDREIRALERNARLIARTAKGMPLKARRALAMEMARQRHVSENEIHFMSSSPLARSAKEE